MYPWAKTTQSQSAPNDTGGNFTTKGIYGLEICYEDDQAVADVVFVHGLTGNRRTTWTSKSNNTFWPQDLLSSDLPRTRIMTYGYDADIAHFWAMASQNRIGEHAGNLINALTQIRERTDTEGRPIVFVTHSLGGLVTEDALLYSKNSPELHLQDVIHSVVGICFLGTPHCGSDLARWGGIAGSLINAIKTANVDLVNVLQPNSEVLARVQREFHGMLRTLAREKRTSLDITCFYEELPVRGAGEIVPKHSAILPSYNYIGIHANHMDMTKFSSTADPGYLSVSGELRRWVKAVQKRSNAEGTRPESVTNTNEPPVYPPMGTYPRNHSEDPRNAYSVHSRYEETPYPAVSYSASPLPYTTTPNPYGAPPSSAGRYAPPPPWPRQYAPDGGPEFSPPSSYTPQYSPYEQGIRYARPPPPPEPRYIEESPRVEEYSPHAPGIYQGANVFNGNVQTHSGGKSLQGNFHNAGGTMNF